jgi:hypothetical protein
MSALVNRVDFFGTAVDGNGAAVGTVPPGTTAAPAPSATTGMTPSGPSGPRLDGGGRDESRPGGQGVSRKPPS